ncbi:uncharacterized protein DS421_2g37020 [Arachis hypogaea]|nr:uncharacterized protein DS421_2g37020 [Arachis hypogaea]
MLMQPFPDISTIFSILLHQERQHSALYLGDTKELVNAMNTTGEGFNHDNRGRNFGRGGHGAEMNDEFSNTPSLSGQKEGSQSFDALFSEEQKQALIALLLKHEPSPSYSKSAAATVQAPSAGSPFLEDDWSC